MSTETAVAEPVVEQRHFSEIEAESIEARRAELGDAKTDDQLAKSKAFWDESANPTATSTTLSSDNANVLKSIDESLKAIAQQTAPPPVKTLSEMTPAEYAAAMDAFERHGTPLPPVGEAPKGEVFAHPEVVARRQRDFENRRWADEMDRQERERSEDHQRRRDEQQAELKAMAKKYGLRIEALSELPQGGSVQLSAEELEKLSPQQFAELMDEAEVARRRR